ncbi:MAG: (2Fe-2S)-binding protein [Magnetovibrio sp.]|nr:(2Fe-2S)-binding protein [Magnetovibrio sp.]|tara:strand:- start:1534 stop:1878 length:345 start_codon:yes stop_codon:yes gene_type:complete
MACVLKKLCELNQIDNNGSATFVAEKNGKKESLIVVRKKNKVFVYINSCPHIGTPLDFSPGQFLSKDKNFILCSTHGALFRISDGFCISGPCFEQTLTKVSVRIIDDKVFIVSL